MNDMEYLENPYYTLVVWNVDRREWFGAEVCRSSAGYLAMDKGNIACSDSMIEELSYYNPVWRVIVTEDDQASIDAGIERLNSLVEI